MSRSRTACQSPASGGAGAGTSGAMVTRVPLFDAHAPFLRDALGEGFPAFESAMRAFDFPAALQALGGSAQR